MFFIVFVYRGSQVNLGIYLARIRAVLAPTWPVLAPSWAALAPSWAVLGASWPPKNLPRSFQDASKTSPKTRSNVDLNLGAFETRKTWKTSIQERLKKNLPWQVNGKLVYIKQPRTLYVSLEIR